MGTHWPLMRIMAGEWADRYTSDAFFSAIKRRIRSIVPETPVVAMVQSLLERRIVRGESVAQQVVQAGLGAGLRVDPLDDDGGVQAVFAIIFGQATADDD